MGISSRIRLFLFYMLLFAAPIGVQGASAPTGNQSGKILILGDSISAGYGLENPDQGWVGLLDKKIKSLGKPWETVNASISGETSAGGLSRIDALLQSTKPGILVLELGANDGLRALQPSQMKTNLNEIIIRAKKSGAKIVLLGMRIPPNYGNRYNELFEAVFPELATLQHVAYVPFLLEGVGGNKQMMQPDGLHPNTEAQPVLMRLVWEKLEPLL